MIVRTLVSSLVGVAVAGGVFVPIKVSARGGGFVAGPAVVAPSGVPGGPAGRFVPVNPGVRHVVPRQIPAHIRPHRFAPELHRGRGAGGAFYESYDPYQAAPYYGQPAYTEAPYIGSINPAVLGGGVPPYPRRCRSVVETVPSARGGTSEVTITRC